MAAVVYYLDGTDLKTYGVYVSASDGLLSRPKPKNPVSQNWPDHHGEVVDLTKRYYEARKIKLDCFIKATSKEDFVTKMNTFLALFDATGTRRLMVVVDATKPLVYEVYLSNAIEPKKSWSDAEMAGTFATELTESAPMKRVVKITGTSLSITLTTAKLVDIFWGDGAVTRDVIGTSQTKTHTYSSGTYYAIVAGNIDDITAFSTTGTTIWSKL
jgi:hypothetical protein